MASYSCNIVVMVVVICACGGLENIVCTRPSSTIRGGAAQDAAAGGSKREAVGGDTWKLAGGYSKAAGDATWKQRSGYDGSTRNQGIGCSPCAEVYVVRDEGETLQTISEKCHAPFILLDNPHVQDTDDISTGSVLLISSTHLPCTHL